MGQIYELLSYLSPALLILIILIGIRNYRLSDKNRLLFFYAIACLLIDLTARYVIKIIGLSNNLFLLSILCIVEIIIFARFYLYSLKNKRFVYILSALGIAYIAGELIYNIDAEITYYQSYARVVSSLVVALLAQIYIYRSVADEKEIPTKELRLNYVILMYFALEFIFLLPVNFLVNSKSKLIYVTWFGHLLVVIFFYAYIAYYMWTEQKGNRIRK